jgi:hypothetical protein
MNKTFKNCLLASFLLVIFTSCSAVSIIAGYSIGTSQKEDQTTGGTGGSTTDISEKPIYYEQGTPQRYLDENSPSDVYQKLISDSRDHFTFEFKVQDQNQFQKDRDFISANIENQYSRLTVKFDTEISNKITVRLVDDLDVFQDDLDTMLIGPGVTPYSAFALGDDLIEIYINPLMTTEKFDLTHTISHEMVHVFQYYINDTMSTYNPNWTNATWFIEGMAEGFAYPNEEALIHDDIYQQIPDISALNSIVDSNNAEEYMVGYDAVELFFVYLSETYGEDKMIQMVECQISFDQCFTQIIGKNPNTAYSEWLQTL